MSDQDWPEYDGQGEEDALPTQQGDDEGDVGVAELRRELLKRAPKLPFLQSFLGEAMRWLDEEESTEVMLAATNLLEANLQLHRGPWAEILRDLRDSLSHDEGEDMLYALLRLVKELQRA
ncbi:hypothetical protein JST97_36380 [bacterium]|nr:hypothetical protein [bacterium]